MRLIAAAAAVAAAAGALAVGCAIQDARSAFPRVLELQSTPVEIAPSETDGLRLRGTVKIIANHSAFGGISGMLIDGDTIVAVSDHGWLLQSPLVDDARGLRPEGGRISPLLDKGGSRLEEGGRDAEGLARMQDGRLAISFERDHRITFLNETGHIREVRDRAFEQLEQNKGLEALATLPDGRLLAIAEARATGGFPAFLIDPDGTVRSGRLALPGARPVTGADLGPDGRLYILRRDFSFISGFSIRVERYRLAADGFPLPETRERLAAFDGFAIDNMEAIALWQDGDGRTRLAIASDDNYRAVLQRTLLMDFEVLD